MIENIFSQQKAVGIVIPWGEYRVSTDGLFMSSAPGPDQHLDGNDGPPLKRKGKGNCGWGKEVYYILIRYVSAV